MKLKKAELDPKGWYNLVFECGTKGYCTVEYYKEHYDATEEG